MAGHKLKRPKLPLCAGEKHDGSPCNSYRELGSDFCRWHIEQDELLDQARAAAAEQSREEAVKAEPDLEELVSEHRAVDPSRLRHELAADIAGSYGLIPRVLQDAMQAQTERAARCPKCTFRFQVAFPDYRARVEAAKTAVEMGYGKAPQAPDDEGPIDLDIDVKTLHLEERAELRRKLIRVLGNSNPVIRAYNGEGRAA